MSSVRSRSDHSSQYQYRLLPWIVWGLACLFYFYEFLLQVSPGVMSHELMKDFSVTAKQLGMLSGAYFISYAGMQIPVGILIDRYGAHKLLTIACAICAIASLLFGMTSNLMAASIARFATGFGSAFAVVGTMKLAANWFPSERFAFLTGLMVMIGMLGAIGGETPLAITIHHVGWRLSIIGLAVAGVLLSIALYLVARDHPPHFKAHQSSKPPAMAGLKKVLKNRQLWIVALYGGLMYAPTPVFCGLWGVPFIIQKYGVSSPVAAGLVSLVFLGWVIGSPLWGAISDRIGRRLLPMRIGSVGALLSFAALLYLPVSISIFSLLLLIFGLFSSGFLTAFSIARETSRPSYTATSLSFMNMMNMVGVAIAQPLIGKILDNLWDGKILDGVRIYSLSLYQSAISLLVLSIFASILLLPFIKETHCKTA